MLVLISTDYVSGLSSGRSRLVNDVLNRRVDQLGACERGDAAFGHQSGIHEEGALTACRFQRCASDELSQRLPVRAVLGPLVVAAGEQAN